jgi:Pectate lyase superfamily protein/Chaperone of endosialidase
MQYQNNQNCCSNGATCFTGCGQTLPIVPGTNPALQTWNGQNFVVADGSEQNPISLPFLKINQDPATYFVGADNNGRWSYYNPTNMFNGDNIEVTATGSTTARTLANRFADALNVKDFGAVGDGVTDDTAAFQLAANSINNKGCIYVPYGNYVISSSISGLNYWVLDNNVSIIGLPPLGDGTNPIANIDNISRLGGRAINILNIAYGAGFQIGSTTPWLEQYIRPSAESRAEVAVLSPYGQIAITGASKSSDNPSGTSTDLSTIGGNFYSINDKNRESGETCTAYAIYAEARRRNITNVGAAFGAEMDIANQAGVVTFNPGSPLSPDYGYTGGLLLNSGAGLSGTLYDASFGLAFGSNSAKFERGIVFNSGSISNTYLEAISMPILYNLAWYSGTTKTTVLDDRQHSRNVNSDSNTPIYDAAIKQNSSNASTQNLESIFQSNSYGTYLGSPYLGAYTRVLQRSSFSGANAQFSYDIQATNQDGTASQLSLNGLGNKSFGPTPDNSISLGLGSFRWSTVYAATGTINTSDLREKQQIRSLSDAEKAVAISLKGLIKAFKFNDAVEKKGDRARIHFGVIAQEVKSAFEAEGLVAEKYAVFCYDEWDAQEEVKDNKGNVIQPAREAGNRYGVRYDELFAFIISQL